MGGSSWGLVVSLRPWLKVSLWVLLAHGLSGCQLGYIASSAYHQAKLLNSRESIESILEKEKYDKDIRRKLQLVLEVKEFSEKELGLAETNNYTSYVQLERPYVTYVVSASPKDKIKAYLWSFPFVGSFPYKGYPHPEGAKEEAEELKSENYDTFIRGVSAYSTLGWFNDPILSSMMRYNDEDLVNTIIHETVHATLYIKNNARFNERLASFLGDMGTKLFYEKKDPGNTEKAQMILDENEDRKKFSQFISAEIRKLSNWYKDHREQTDFLKLREEQFSLVKKNFEEQVLPKMKTKIYANFSKRKINNAVLVNYKTYMMDQNQFSKLSDHFDNDFSKVLDYCKSLAKEKDAEKALGEFLDAV